MSLYTISIPFQVSADKGTFDKSRAYIDEHIGPKMTYDLGASTRFNRVLVSKLVDDPYFQYYIIEFSSSLQERKEQKLALVKEMRQMSAEIAAELGK